MSRFYSYTPNRMPSAHSTPSYGPVTPAAKRRGSGSLGNSKLQDSPFSDYFTDDGNSPSIGHDSTFRAHSEETQQLLVRLDRLQKQLMQSSPEDILSEHQKAVIVGRKISEIETQFHALTVETQSQTRLPPDLEDSGLFMDDDDAENEETPDAQMDSFERAAKAYLTADAEDDGMKATHDALLNDAHTVLQNVSKANERLRLVNAELRANHEKCGRIIDALELENAELRAKTTQLEFDNNTVQSNFDTLQTKTENLKMDLSFNRANLLYLKLRHRALEVKTEALHNGAHRLESHAPELREEIQQIKRAKIREEMSIWEDQWLEIEQKMRRSRSKHADSDEDESLRQLLALSDADEDAADVVEVTNMVKVEKTTSMPGDDSAVGIEDTPSPPTAESIPEEFVGTIQADQSTQTGPSVEVQSDVQLEQVKPFYADQITQTTPLPSPATMSWVLNGDENDELQSNTKADDCAIITSSEDNSDEPYSDISTNADIPEEASEGNTPASPIRAAWQDLWDGLTNLAGMGEGY